MSDLIYTWHQMRDILISMWQLSPTMIVIIALVLLAAIFFVLKR